MLALEYKDKCVLRDDYPLPQPAKDEALVAVRLAGVCRTDLEILKGYMSFSGVIGHEFVGQVVQGPRRLMGKLVVAEINCVCGRCDMCKRGLSNHCRNRTVVGIDGRDGVFAQYVALPVQNLHEVPPGVSERQAVFAEPLAAAMQIVRQVKIGPCDKVTVLGDGKLGQLVAQVLSRRRPLLVGKHRGKLETAEKRGIQTALLDEFTPRQDADVVVDATGSVHGFDIAMRTVRPRGTIVLKSTFAARGGINLTPLAVNEVTVVGSRCGPIGDALAALASGQVDVLPLISATFPLAQGLKALEATGDHDKIKVLIEA